MSTSVDDAIRVVVVDDHPMFRAGLRTLVEESPLLCFAGEADNGADAVALCLRERPEVVLMDVKMPGGSGVEATRELLHTAPDIGVLMLTMLEDDTSVFAAMRAGARGYILKGAAPSDIERAVVAVAAGEVIFGAALARRMAHFFTAGRSGEPPSVVWKTRTTGETSPSPQCSRKRSKPARDCEW